MKKRALLLLMVLSVLGTAGFTGPAQALHGLRTTAAPIASAVAMMSTAHAQSRSATPLLGEMPARTAALTIETTATASVQPTNTPATMVATATPATSEVQATSGAPATAPATLQSSSQPAPARELAPVPAPSRWVGFYLPGVPDSMTALNALQSRIGVRAAVVNFFVADSESFPAPRCNNVVRSGATPLVTLEFWSTKSGGLSAITNGSRDAYIRSFARDARAFGKTVWLRPFHEMNGSWYPWGASGSNTPAKLVAAWKHVHDIFAEAGATNVKFVWCPNVGFPVKAYFPGEAYVDYAALDGYNFGKPWTSFASSYGRTYDQVAALTAKPMFVAETASAPGSGKAAWIAEMFAQINTRFTRITGVVWFNVNKEHDWRVEDSTADLRAFRRAVAAGF